MTRSTRKFLVLIVALLALCGAYVGFWFYARGEAENAFTRFVEAERARGHQLSFAAAEWGGFPFRLSVTLTDMRWASDNLALAAGSVRAEVQPWQPRHALIRAEGDVKLTRGTAGEPNGLEASPLNLFASVRFDGDGDPQQVDVEMRQVGVSGREHDGDPIAFAARRLQFDARAAREEAGAVFDVAASADGLVLDERFEKPLGREVASVRAAARIRGLAPLRQTIDAIGADGLVKTLRAADAAMEVARLDVEWGGASLKGVGAMKLDAQGRPEGRIDFVVSKYARLVQSLVTAEALEPPPVDVAALPEPPGGAPVSFVIENGQATFGPFDAGPIRPIE